MSPDPGGLPRAPLRAAVVFVFILLALQAVAQCIKYIAILRGDESVAQEIAQEAVPASLPGLE
jgi:TRAP-type mannitol/chloroaromatic compound transport system permease small subunit